jgi:Tail tubular protein
MSMTRLEAVNRMLSALGEDPVNSLSSGLSDAESAERFLTRVSRTVQTTGWHANTDRGLRLLPNVATKEIALPHNTLKIDSVGSDGWRNVTKRGRRLYDVKSRSFKFDRPVTVDIVTELPWEDLTYALQNYISALAAQQYQVSEMGSVAMDNFASREVREAWEVLLSEEAENEDSNVLDNPDLRAVTRRRRLY